MARPIVTTVLVACGALWLHSAAWAQVGGNNTASDASEVPRTPWGDPDLQGIWDYRTITPTERPEKLGDREFYTEEEIAELERRASERLEEPPEEGEQTGLVHAAYTTDPGSNIDESRRTSLVVDPPNGRIPELTVAGQERQAAQRQRRGDGSPADPNKPWLDRPMLERCISRGLPQAILPGLYNNNIAIIQSPESVAIVHEMIHETRLVPLKDGDFTGVRGYMGESRGHWEGDTLVVETRNFNDEVSYRGSTDNLVLTERYTRISPDTIDFTMTIDDDANWTKPWTVAYQMRPTGGHLYEYACHEGNLGLRNILENIYAAAADAAASTD